MTGWTSDELARIGAADELELAPLGAGGRLRRPVTIWVVRVGDQLFIRSWRGSDGRWWRNARAGGAGRISAGGVEKDIAFEEVDPRLNDAVDAGYREKYGRYPTYVEPMVSSQARATTLRLIPRNGSEARDAT
jgi:hypothetical protein